MDRIVSSYIAVQLLIFVSFQHFVQAIHFLWYVPGNPFSLLCEDIQLLHVPGRFCFGAIQPAGGPLWATSFGIEEFEWSLLDVYRSNKKP